MKEAFFSFWDERWDGVAESFAGYARLSLSVGATRDDSMPSLE